MTPSDRPTVRVDSPAEALALVPYLLGFHPASSLVAVAVTDPTVVGLAHMNLATDGLTLSAATALHRIAALMSDRAATSAILIGYGTAAQAGPSLRAATDVLDAAGIPVRQTLRVEAGRYWLSVDGTPVGPPQGRPFDPSTSVAAATATAAGLVALPDRETLAARLSPVTGPARTRMITATSATARALLDLIKTATGDDGPDADTSPHTPAGDALLSFGRTVLAQAQQHYQTRTPADDEQVAAVTVLLALPQVRQFAAHHATGTSWEIDMWTDMTRRAEPEFVTGPAILLALCALQTGDGALANVAVERAQQTDPGNQTVNLLATAVHAGIDPALLAALLSD